MFDIIEVVHPVPPLQEVYNPRRRVRGRDGSDSRTTYEIHSRFTVANVGPRPTLSFLRSPDPPPEPRDDCGTLLDTPGRDPLTWTGVREGRTGPCLDMSDEVKSRFTSVRTSRHPTHPYGVHSASEPSLDQLERDVRSIRDLWCFWLAEVGPGSLEQSLWPSVPSGRSLRRDCPVTRTAPLCLSGLRRGRRRDAGSRDSNRRESTPVPILSPVDGVPTDTPTLPRRVHGPVSVVNPSTGPTRGPRITCVPPLLPEGVQTF